MNSLIIDKKANEFRSMNGLGPYDPIQIRSLLNKLNVITVYKPLRANFGGLSIKIGNGSETKRFILVNCSRTIGNQNFTVAHECYHLFHQENFSFSISPNELVDRKSGEEYNADCFASSLLLPEIGVKSLIPDNELIKNRITLKTILKIEQYFGTSRMALLSKLKHFEIIDTQHSEKFSKDVKRGALENGYALDLYEPGNNNLVVGDYGSIAKELFDKEKISESHYFSLLFELGMNIEEIEEIQYAKHE